MNIMNVRDAAFAKYGKVVDFICTKELEAVMENTPVTEGVEYVPSVEALENTGAFAKLTEQFYGGMPIQIGYCNGHNHKLNALEYHRDSELDLACTADMILLLGCQQDIDPADFSYDTAKVEAFLLPKGVMVELYATTLHYAPVSVGDSHFRCVVVLPKGTNTELKFRPDTANEPGLLTATNKWLIAHPEGGIENAHIGLKGENITL